jgi:hypothetical protein
VNKKRINLNEYEPNKTAYITLGVSMDWNRIGTNWSELKGKAKRQLESCKDYNIDMNKNDLKHHAISFASIDGANQETTDNRILNPHKVHSENP